MKKPNILIIMTDQQRFDSLGCYGADWIKTPNLDRLASEGMLFERCYVNNPICTPSRASMFTGKHLPEHGVYRLHDVLPDTEVLFPKYLKEEGYKTALFGKLHVSGRVFEENQRHPNDGFDEYEWCLEASISMDSPFNGYSRWLKEKNPEFHSRLKKLGRKLTNIPKEYHLTHWAAERTVDFINRHSGETPFFCMMSVFDPHNPYDDVPVEYLDRVDLKKMPKPVVAKDERRHTIPGILREQMDGYFGSFEHFSDMDFKKIRRGYYASLVLLDEEVGRVLGALDEKGIAEETLVIFLSDHGDMLGDHGLMVKGAYFYDPCVRVPMIIRQPGVVRAGVRSDALVQPHDVAATVLSAAGLADDKLKSVMPHSRDIRKAESACHSIAVCTYQDTGISNTGRYFEPPICADMIFDGRYKLNLYYPSEGVPGRVEGQLFDLLNDPGERKNLFETDTVNRLRLTEEFIHWQYRMLRETGIHAESVVPKHEHLVDNSFDIEPESNMEIDDGK